MGSLILLRHVESQWTAQRRFTGSSDVPITPSGERSARALGATIERLHVDVAYVSSLQRARQTLEAVVGALGRSDIPIFVEPALNERSFGVLEGMDKRSAEKEFGKAELTRWRSSFTEAPPQGESLAETAARTDPLVLETLLPAARAGQHVLVVAHGDSLRTVMMAVEQLAPEAVLELRLQPGELVFYQISADGFVERQDEPTANKTKR